MVKIIKLGSIYVTYRIIRISRYLKRNIRFKYYLIRSTGTFLLKIYILLNLSISPIFTFFAEQADTDGIKKSMFPTRYRRRQGIRKKNLELINRTKNNRLSLVLDRRSIFPREEVRWLLEDFTVDYRQRGAKQKTDQKESRYNRIPEQLEGWKKVTKRRRIKEDVTN